MSSTYIAEQYISGSNQSYFQTFIFQGTDSGSLAVQLDDSSFTNDWVPVVATFIESNGNSGITSDYLAVIIDLISEQLIDNAGNTSAGRFVM